jgi:hypothetical protein
VEREGVEKYIICQNLGENRRGTLRLHLDEEEKISIKLVRISKQTLIS